MSSQHILSPIARSYVLGVVLAGTAALVHSLYLLYAQPVSYQWLTLAALTLLSGSFTVKVPRVHSSISVSETFVIISVLVFGPAAATITVAFEGLIISLWLLRRSREIYRVFFNMAAAAVSIWTASHLFYVLVDRSLFVSSKPALIEFLLPLTLFTLLYFLLNSWLIVFAVSLETKAPPVQIWIDNFAWLSLNYFGGASVAVLLVQYTRDVTFSAIGLIVPFLLITYLTFKTAMGRVEDANQHLLQLNKLHLSTIETLAMAIDAKDQITHGHIRRVQQYAVGLARALGISDEVQIRAIEAASLLHDMGKLAVPEYILNKPGKLTAAEFEKMKLHAEVGADILSAIEFPYPVVPIVRHHHEFWNGKGYPTGISGTEIPIGARILSVVDCFDALTSDRPYRPRLPDSEAIEILKNRRGTMYDPLVVDTFLAVHEQITPREPEIKSQRRALAEITRSSQPANEAEPVEPVEQNANAAEELLSLYDFADAVAGDTGLSDVGDVIAKHLKKMTPASLCVFYLYDSDRDDIFAAHASGESESAVRGLRITVAERLSGWVAANRQTIVNSNPELDLGAIARSPRGALRSCLSTPMLTGESLVGVLALYAEKPDAFSDDHRRLAEIVAQRVSSVIRRGTEFERTRQNVLRDPLTGLPNVEYLKRFTTWSDSAESGPTKGLTLVFVDIDSFGLLNEKHGTLNCDRVLSHVVKVTKRNLRAADILFRYENDEFVILLPNTDLQTAGRIGTRLCESIRESPIELDGTSIWISVAIGIACSPLDGNSLRELVQAAKTRLGSGIIEISSPVVQTSPSIH